MPGQRGDKGHRRIGKILKSLLHGKAKLLGRAGLARAIVPLVHDQDAGTACLVRIAADFRVLGRDALHRVQQDQRHVRPAHGGQGAGDAVPLHRPADAALGTDPGRVHQDVVPAVVAEPGVHGVPGRPRLGTDQDTLGPQDPVDQRRLSHVGPADDRHGDRSRFRRRGLLPGHLGSHRIQELADARALLRRDGKHLGESQPVKVGCQGLLAGGIHLVHDKEDGSRRRLPEQGRHLDIGGGEPVLGVHHEEDHARLGHGLLRLDAHQGHDARGLGLESAGIHQDQAPAAPVALPIEAVAGDTGGVIDDGAPAAQQAVEERGLPHVGPAHDGDDGCGHADLPPSGRTCITEHPPPQTPTHPASGSCLHHLYRLSIHERGVRPL